MKASAQIFSQVKSVPFDSEVAFANYTQDRGVLLGSALNDCQLQKLSEISQRGCQFRIRFETELDVSSAEAFYASIERIILGVSHGTWGIRSKNIRKPIRSRPTRHVRLLDYKLIKDRVVRLHETIENETLEPVEVATRIWIFLVIVQPGINGNHRLAASASALVLSSHYGPGCKFLPIAIATVHYMEQYEKALLRAFLSGDHQPLSKVIDRIFHSAVDLNLLMTSEFNEAADWRHAAAGQELTSAP